MTDLLPASVEGTVTKTEKPAVGAYVRVEMTNAGEGRRSANTETETDQYGHFALHALPPGEYTFSVSEEQQAAGVHTIKVGLDEGRTERCQLGWTPASNVGDHMTELNGGLDVCQPLTFFLTKKTFEGGAGGRCVRLIVSVGRPAGSGLMKQAIPATSSNAIQCRLLRDQKSPAAQDATQSKKRFMDIGTLLVADSQSAKLVQPGKAPLHNHRHRPRPLPISVFLVLPCRQARSEL